ncbi:MAG TPA: hypothetical protein VF120_13000 [Ktedonobacterales bacterium]
MSEANTSGTQGYYTRNGSLPRLVSAQPAPQNQRDSVYVDGQPARIDVEFFDREGSAVVAALLANVEEEQRLRHLLNTQGDDDQMRGRLVEVNERIVTLQQCGAELEQLTQAGQDSRGDTAPSAPREQ